MSQNVTKFSYPHPVIDFDKVFFHLHRLGTAIYMDTYFKAWAYKESEKFSKDYYPETGKFDDLYLFFKQGQFYGKYNIKLFGYKVLDHFIDKKHFDQYLQNKNDIKKEIEALWKKYPREEVKKISTQDQIALIQESLLIMIRSFAADPIAPMIGEVAVDYTNWWLESKNLSNEEKTKATHLLFASDKVSETIRRQIDIRNRLESATDENQKEKVLTKLAQEYAFARTEYSGYLPFDKEEILSEYEAAKNTTLNTEKEIEEKNNLLEKLGANAQEKWIFYLFGYCQYSRDERKDYLQKPMAVIDWALFEIADKFNIDINFLRASLIGELSIEKLKDQEYLALLERRYEEGIIMYWQDDGDGKYIVGEEGEKIFNSIDNKVSDSIELKGQPTYYGKVTGKVKIISDPKMKVPDEPFVLVTGMTSPDFIHFMQKCVAIVTDEGGITSHAAILSRELKKPCIVGVKIARKTLKDGDLVEVDADKGVVKIIKQLA